MAYQLPDGSIITLGTTYGAAKTVTALTNAAPPVAQSTAHGLINGTFVEVTSGWQSINQRIARVSGQTTNAFNYEGLDTTNTTANTVGGGVGSVREITAFTELPQVLGFTTSGGDQQFTQFAFLAENFERQLPTIFSAQSLTLTMADDPAQAGILALQAASDARAIRALKLALPNGSAILYNGYVSYNPTPTLNKGSIMQVTATFSLVGRPVRYAS